MDDIVVVSRVDGGSRPWRTSLPQGSSGCGDDGARSRADVGCMDRIAGGMWGLDRTADRGGTAMDVSRHQGRRSDAVGTAADDRAARASTVPAGLTVPGILLGVGLGGFVDG